MYIFYTVVTWVTCVPVSEIDLYINLAKNNIVPEWATCFSKNHMKQLSFHAFPPINESLFKFLGMAFSLLVISAFLISPLLRLKKFMCN
jgi:hypothetical protein